MLSLVATLGNSAQHNGLHSKEACVLSETILLGLVVLFKFSADLK